VEFAVDKHEGKSQYGKEIHYEEEQDQFHVQFAAMQTAR